MNDFDLVNGFEEYALSCSEDQKKKADFGSFDAGAGYVLNAVRKLVFSQKTSKVKEGGE